MHSSSFDTEVYNKDGGDVLVSIATLITEGRIPGGLKSTAKKFYEGPHCTLVKGANKGHKCDVKDSLCLKFENDRETILSLYQKGLPLCIEVILTCACKDIDDITDSQDNAFVLEQWHFSVKSKRSIDPLFFNLNQLVSAIRSQLYFSQITAWLSTQDKHSNFKIVEDNFRYHLTVPGKTFATPKFHLTATKHEFPLTDIENGHTLNVSFFSLPRSSTIPDIICNVCATKPKKNCETKVAKLPNCCETKIAKKFTADNMDLQNGIVDDIMYTSCTLKGKHRCEDFEEDYNVEIDNKLKRLCQTKIKNNFCEASTSKPKLKVNIEKSNLYNLSKSDVKTEKRIISPNLEHKLKSAKLDLWQTFEKNCQKDDLSKDKGQLLLDAIERSGQKCAKRCECDTDKCDKRKSDIFSIKQTSSFNFHVEKHCDSPIPVLKQKKMRDISNIDPTKRAKVRQKLTFDGEEKNCDKNFKEVVDVPSPSEQAKFRKNLDSAASMVFHSRTGLPLTSSPAPVRRGKSCFDFDSSINSVSAIKSALFSSSFSTDEESESEGGFLSPCSPDTYIISKRDASPIKFRRKGHAANLLGSFEESVLNGRLEPVSTVHGFTAELGASGSFVPKHLVVPVTVFFYTLGDNDKVSSPYLSHINLGKKGYNIPKSGTVQVTLFNPLGTVVKMFVIMYDLTDMPPNSQTFIRQRTLYMPTNCKDANLEWGPKWLRYLIHLKFMSSKSGKIYLHSDIRMIIFRKCDMDTATAHGIDMSYELRSFTHMPANPRFSPRK